MLPAVLALLTQLPMPASEPQPAGVVLVVVDDAGKESLRDAAGHTPCLDEIRERGLWFETFGTMPACSPTRSEIMSGRYAFRDANRVGHVIQPKHGEAWSMPTDDRLPAWISGVSSCIGKWHLGTPSRLDHPRECGFTYWSGTQYNLGGDGSYYAGPDWIVNGTQTGWRGYITTKTAREAIGRMLAGDRLVYVSFHAPHKPFEAPPDSLHTYGDLTGADDHLLSLAMLEACDQGIGAIAETARSFGYLLIVCTDNGTAGLVGGDKGTLREGGTTCWAAAEGPGVRHGEVHQPIQATDLFATIIDVLEGAEPAGYPDSISFRPMLYAPLAGAREFLYAEQFSPNGQVPTSWDRTIRDERWKLWLLADGTRELYDLDTDPDEAVDLLADGTSQEEGAIVAHLEGMLPR